MRERTLSEIEDEIDENVPLGNIGKVMDLVDEHGNTIDKMFLAVQEGDLDRIKWLESLEIDVSTEPFVRCSVLNDQLLVIAYQVLLGTNIDLLISIAKEYDKPAIWHWAKCWKSVNARNN